MLKKTNDGLLNLFQHLYRFAKNYFVSPVLWILKRVQNDALVLLRLYSFPKSFRLILSLLFFSSVSLPLQGAASFSLLFNPQEVDLIREHLEGGGDIDTIIPEVTVEAIHLSAIMFMDAHNWTVWLNDQMIHAGELLDSLPFQIKEVTPYEVTLQWKPPGSAPQSFKLRAGQSFHPEKGNF